MEQLTQFVSQSFLAGGDDAADRGDDDKPSMLEVARSADSSPHSLSSPASSSACSDQHVWPARPNRSPTPGPTPVPSAPEVTRTSHLGAANGESVQLSVILSVASHSKVDFFLF